MVLVSTKSSIDKLIAHLPKETSVNEEESHILVNHRGWHAVQFDPGSLGFGDGMVSEISALLSAHGISIYYISGCTDDYILVEEQHMSKVMKLYA